MRLFLITPLLWLLALPAWADARMTVLVDVMKLNEGAQILQAEGLAYGQELNTDMLNGQGGAGFQMQLEAIYDTGRMVEEVRRALEAELQGEMLEQAITFFASDLGQEIIDLENSARVAIGDDDVEQVARGRYAELAGSDDPRLGQVTELVQSGDLINRNVTSALNANYQFMRGLVDGKVIEMSDAQILSDVSGDMDAITEDTTGWLYGYFLLAYHPLSDAQLQDYITFSQTDAGMALNRGLFEGFGKAYEDISYGLGRAVALNMAAEEL